MSFNRETGMYEGYIYVITNDIYPNKLYIGQTSQELITRWYSHVGQVKKHSSTDRLHNTMNKYGIEHFAMDGLEKCTATTKKELISKLDDREKYYIKLFDSFHNGFNLTKGGRDGSENKMRAVKQYDINGNYINTYESVDKLKEIFGKTSVIYSCCNGESKYAYGHIWRYIENELEDFPLPTDNEKEEALIRYYSLLQIDKYDYRGNLLHVYKNTTEAAKAENTKRSFIVECCIGKRVYIGINIFRFHHELFSSHKTYREKPKLVEQYDLNGNFINVYESVREAGRQLNINYQVITQVCRNEIKTAYGYIWKYVENALVIPDLQHKGNCKKVFKYDRDGNLIKVYLSVIDASIEEDVSYTTIINSCNQQTNSIFSNYTYSHDELTPQEVENKFRNKKSKRINMYTKDGFYIRTFDSCINAGKYIGHRNSSILIGACCRKKKVSGYGYKWYFSDDLDQPDKTRIIT